MKINLHFKHSLVAAAKLNNLSNLVAIYCLALLVNFSSQAQCKEEQKAVDDLQKEYSVLFVDLEKQSEELKKVLPDTNDMPSPDGHHASFEIINMRRRNISFDLIDVTMRNKVMSFHVPQVTMKTKSFSIPTSKTEWKVTNVGLGIKTKTLVITNGSRKVSFKLPETKMERTEIITKIPEFTKKRKDISLNVPEIKMKSPIPEDEKFNDLQKKSEVIAQRADTLSKEGARLEKDQKEKSKVAINNLFSCIEKELNMQKISANKLFEESILQLNTAISEVQSHGLDPYNVKSEDGTTTNLHSIKDELSKAHQETTANIDNAIKEINEQLVKIMNELNA